MMSTKFFEGVGGKLAEQWVANLLTPAFIFWSGGILAYVYRFGWEPIFQLFPNAKFEGLQLAALAGILVLIYISAIVVQRFDIEVLRALEGYWYPGVRKILRPVLKRMTQRHISYREQCFDEWEPLNDKLEAHQTLSQNESANFTRYDRILRQFPGEEADFLPTRIGNLIRAAERRPLVRYGLDTIICWPRLWLLLSDNTKKEIQEARAQLNNCVRVFTWSLLFPIWTIWAWWAAPIGIVSVIFAYCWLFDVAEVYNDLIESAFDLYRTALYQSLRVPLPKNPQEELKIGRQVTEYLFRGKPPTALEFTPPPSSDKK
jgi:hypothetical protein